MKHVSNSVTFDNYYMFGCFFWFYFITLRLIYFDSWN